MMTCGNCQNWREPDADGVGECWSLDRLDHDLSAGPAGYHRSTATCEAWLKRLPPIPHERTAR